jgi:GNAT superfamily N-acetyltransferase
MTTADIPAGLRLCRQSGWNQTARDWELLLSLAPEGAIVAEVEGVVVGTVIAVPYRPAFDWIAMMLVVESMRGRGVGRILMQRALDICPGAVRLDATDAGRRLYLTLGFEDEFTLTRWRTGSATTRLVPPAVRPIRENDWDDIAALDCQAFGADRMAVLRGCWGNAGEYGWLVRASGQLAGFVLGRHGHLSEHIGPLVALSDETAAMLLDACLHEAHDRVVTIDVHDPKDTFRGALQDRAFEPHRHFTRMRRGVAQSLTASLSAYAATGPELA